MSEEARVVDVGVGAGEANDVWPAIVIPRARIQGEIERLTRIAGPKREAMFVHPRATRPGLGLAPGIDVTLLVVNPGEETALVRDNASRLALVIAGAGEVEVQGEPRAVGLHDVWNMPAMQPRRIRNSGADPFAALVYSNAPVLRKLQVFYQEADLALAPRVESERHAADLKRQGLRRLKDSLPPIPVGDHGAALLSYEHLIDIDVVESKSLLWPYAEVSKHFAAIRDLDRRYTGRRVYVLYNPATERRNGTTHSFFATWAVAPGGGMDRLHRHSSAAINYYVEGSGYSEVEGRRLTWSAGDLQLSAPGWAAHAHGSDPCDGVIALTVQDHPFHIANESLIWQEEVDGGEVLTLGAQPGFQTNRAALAAEPA